MSFDSLPPEEQMPAMAQVEAFISLLSRRYGLREEDVPDMIDGLRRFRDQKRIYDRVKAGGLISLIGLSATAAASAIWQGIKMMPGGGK